VIVVTLTKIGTRHKYIFSLFFSNFQNLLQTTQTNKGATMSCCVAAILLLSRQVPFSQCQKQCAESKSCRYIGYNI